MLRNRVRLLMQRDADVCHIMCFCLLGDADVCYVIGFCLLMQRDAGGCYVIGIVCWGWCNLTWLDRFSGNKKFVRPHCLIMTKHKIAKKRRPRDNKQPVEKLFHWLFIVLALLFFAILCFVIYWEWCNLAWHVSSQGLLVKLGSLLNMECLYILRVMQSWMTW